MDGFMRVDEGLTSACSVKVDIHLEQVRGGWENLVINFNKNNLNN